MTKPEESMMTPEQALQNLAKAIPELQLTWWDHVTLQRSLEVLQKLVADSNKVPDGS